MKNVKDMTLEHVFWYHQGDVNNGGSPAIVTQDDGQQGLKLTVLRGMRIELKSGVLNVTDKRLVDRPVLKREQGAWESREQFQERLAEKRLQDELMREQAAIDREAEFKLRREAAKALEPAVS